MTADLFRKMALELPETRESAHMGHPDFRVGGKIFATLGHPSNGWAMVKLTPDEQEFFVRAEPEIFSPVSGGWGRGGATSVRLPAATKAKLHDALVAAWRHRAPKKVIAAFDAERADR